MTQLERAIEAALQPGRFIDYKASWDFVRGVEKVAADVKALIGGGHATDAVALFETFIAASYEKAGELDDSSGNFERARDCYAAAGQQAKWDALVAEVRREHGRQYSFMPGFERVVEGGPAVEPQPSFLQRARSRRPRGGR